MRRREVYVDAIGYKNENNNNNNNKKLLYKEKLRKWLGTQCIYKIHSFLNTKNNLAEIKMEKKKTNQKTGSDHNAKKT